MTEDIIDTTTNAHTNENNAFMWMCGLCVCVYDISYTYMQWNSS